MSSHQTVFTQTVIVLPITQPNLTRLNMTPYTLCINACITLVIVSLAFIPVFIIAKQPLLLAVLYSIQVSCGIHFLFLFTLIALDMMGYGRCIPGHPNENTTKTRIDSIDSIDSIHNCVIW